MSIFILLLDCLYEGFKVILLLLGILPYTLLYLSLAFLVECKPNFICDYIVVPNIVAFRVVFRSDSFLSKLGGDIIWPILAYEYWLFSNVKYLFRIVEWSKL